LKKDKSEYYGPFFPANLAYRIVDLIHRNFLIPSCNIDLNRTHPRACLQYYIGRCLGPCVAGLTTEPIYAEAVRDVKLFLEGRHSDLKHSLMQRMATAAQAEQFELAAKYRDLISTVEDLHQKQRMATAEGDDADVFGYHFENHMVAVNLFHMRGGKVLDRRDFFFEDLGDLETRSGLNTGELFSTLLQQIYLDNKYVPRTIFVPVEFEDREALAEILSEQMHRRIEISVPVRGDKRSLIDLVAQNAKQSYDQRFRVMRPQTDVLKSVLQDTLELPELPNRIECFDISHIQGAETVASMVVWEDGKMKKSDYRKFIIRTVQGVDDFASMREVVTRRYKRLVEEEQPLPSLILIDGGIGQLHAAAEALEAIGVINQPLASIAKREEIIYVYGREDEPIRIDHHSPVLHIVQLIRDEAHRFAVTFHRKRREIRDRSNELLEIPGVGEQTMKRLLRHFGSVQAVRQANAASLEAVVNSSQASAILAHFNTEETTTPQ
jgi:excinuclease ABC subunit C